MTSILRERDVYCTSDLALVAALSLFYPLDAIDHQADGPVVFVFRRAAHLDSLLERYWRGVLRVEPQAYYQQVQVLQHRICKDLPSDEAHRRNRTGLGHRATRPPCLRTSSCTPHSISKAVWRLWVSGTAPGRSKTKWCISSPRTRRSNMCMTTR